MNKKINIDLNTIKIIYARYKQHIFYMVIIIVCVILFLTMIIPRTSELSNLQKEAKNEANKLAVLKNNLNLLSGMNDATLNSQLGLVSKALPVDKDFEGVLNAVSLAAVKSGALLSDYEFQVGDLSQTPSNTSGFPFLKLSLNIKAGPKQSSLFVNELYKSFPLCEVTSIEQGEDSSNIAVMFFYKPLPNIEFNEDKPVQPVSKNDLQFIDKLSSWNYYNISPGSLIAPGASASAPSSPF